jgi:hypothetical protein
MRCKKAKLLMEKYVDGLLDAGASDEMKRHIQNCRECSIQYKIALQIQEEVKRFEFPESEPDWKTFQARLISENSSKTKIKTASIRFDNRIKDLLFGKKLIPIYSGITTLLIFALGFGVMNILMNNSTMLLMDYQKFALEQIKAAEKICIADLTYLKQSTDEILPYLPTEINDMIEIENHLIERKIAISHRLLLDNPTNKSARDMLFASYRKQIKMYQDTLITHEEVQDEI